MKSKNITGILLLISFLLGSSDVLFSGTTEVSYPGEFLIQVETTDSGIRFTGRQGCAFRELNYTLKDSIKKTVDQYGRVTFVRFSTKGIPKEGLADFLFTFMKTTEGICFEGVRGTSWEELSFCYPADSDHQFIDQNGIREFNPKIALTD